VPKRAINSDASVTSTFKPTDRVVWWRGRASGRWNAVFCNVDRVDAERVRVELPGDGRVKYRWIPMERLQPVQAWHEKASEITPPEYEPLQDWGRFTRYLEIGEDLFAVRKVDAFENGFMLRYDRSHWMDRFGSLGLLPYCRVRWEQWWGPSEPVTEQEFNDVWRAAAKTQAYKLQMADGCSATPPPRPPWTDGSVAIGT
jgi:hypothetical protein